MGRGRNGLSGATLFRARCPREKKKKKRKNRSVRRRNEVGIFVFDLATAQ